MACTSSNVPPFKPFKKIPTADPEYIITNTFAPSKKTRTIYTKVLNQLANINTLTLAHECAILNEISSADEPEKIRFQERHRLRKLHVGKLKNKKEGGYQAISDIKIYPETLSSNILGKERNTS